MIDNMLQCYNKRNRISEKELSMSSLRKSKIE